MQAQSTSTYLACVMCALDPRRVLRVMGGLARPHVLGMLLDGVDGLDNLDGLDGLDALVVQVVQVVWGERVVHQFVQFQIVRPIPALRRCWCLW